MFCIEDTSCPFCDTQLSYDPPEYISPNFTAPYLANYIYNDNITDEITIEEFCRYDSDNDQAGFVDENENPDVFEQTETDVDELFDSDEMIVNSKGLDMNNVFENERNELFAQMDENAEEEEDGLDGTTGNNSVADNLIRMNDRELNDAIEECITEMETAIYNPNHSKSEDIDDESLSTQKQDSDITSMEETEISTAIDNLMKLTEKRPFVNITSKTFCTGYSPKEPERDSSFIEKIGIINQLTGEPEILEVEVDERNGIHIEKGFAHRENEKCEDKKVSGLVAFFEKQMKKQN